MKKADLITGVILLVLSGYLIQSASRLPPSPGFGPGAGFLPFWLGVLLAVLAVILLWTAWHRQATEKDKSPFPEKKALILVMGALGGLAAYIVLLDVLGYLVDTFLYVMFLMWIVERERWKIAAAVAVLTAAALYIIFRVLLKVTLPSNMFGL